MLGKLILKEKAVKDMNIYNLPWSLQTRLRRTPFKIHYGRGNKYHVPCHGDIKYADLQVFN